MTEHACTCGTAGAAGIVEIDCLAICKPQPSGLPTPQDLEFSGALGASAKTAMRQEIDRLIPSVDELSELATLEPPKEWLEDKTWAQYDR
jgi:hypothetical protein